MFPEFSLPTLTYGIEILLLRKFSSSPAPAKALSVDRPTPSGTSARRFSNTGELQVVFVLQPQRRRLYIFLKMFNRRGTRNRQHDRGTLQQPGQCNLFGSLIVSLRDPLQQPAGHCSSPQRKPRNEGNSIPLAIVHDVVPLAVGKAVPILHRGNGDDLLRALDVLSSHIRQSDQTNLSLLAQLGQRLN